MAHLTKGERASVVRAVLGDLRDHLDRAGDDAITALEQIADQGAAVGHDAVFEACAQSVGLTMTDVLRRLDPRIPDPSLN